MLTPSGGQSKLLRHWPSSPLSSGSDGSGKSTLAAQEHTQAVQASSAQTDADRIGQRVKEGQKVRITDDQRRSGTAASAPRA